MAKINRPIIAILVLLLIVSIISFVFLLFDKTDAVEECSITGGHVEFGLFKGVYCSNEYIIPSYDNEDTGTYLGCNSASDCPVGFDCILYNGEAVCAAPFCPTGTYDNVTKMCKVVGDPCPNGFELHGDTCFKI